MARFILSNPDCATVICLNVDMSFATCCFQWNVVVDDSLWNTTLQVIVMQGQLDIICNTGGS